MRWGPKSYSRARWLRFMAYYSRIYTVPSIRASPDSPAALNGIGGDQCPTYPNSPHTMINGGDSTDLPSPNHSSCESKPTTEEFLLRTARSTELTEALSGDFLAESAFRCDKNGQRETRIQLLLQFLMCCGYAVMVGPQALPWIVQWRLGLLFHTAPLVDNLSPILRTSNAVVLLQILNVVQYLSKSSPFWSLQQRILRKNAHAIDSSLVSRSLIDRRHVEPVPRLSYQVSRLKPNHPSPQGGGRGRATQVTRVTRVKRVSTTRREALRRVRRGAGVEGLV